MRSLFPLGYAAHDDWRVAARQVVQQLRAQLAPPGAAPQPRLGLIYCSREYAAQAVPLLAWLARELPGVCDWAGSSVHQVHVMGHAPSDEPALAVMLLDLAAAHYRLYSGLLPLAPLGEEASFSARQALVHADEDLPELADLLQELSWRTEDAALAGAVDAEGGVQFALRADDLRAQQRGIHAGVLHGGLSGVAWSPAVTLSSRLCQSCRPLAPPMAVTAAQGHLVTELDGRPALTALLQALGLSSEQGWPHLVEQLRSTRAALSPEGSPALPERISDAARVLDLVGLDRAKLALALSGPVHLGEQLSFCRSDAQVARQDLLQIAAALADAFTPEHDDPAPIPLLNALQPDAQPPWPGLPALPSGASSLIRGALYFSSPERAQLLGGADAELRLLRHALGPVPVIGLQVQAQIMHASLHQHAGVLTVFAAQG